MHQWQNVGPERINLLDVFYKEKERFAYTFQNYVFLTRMMKVTSGVTHTHTHRHTRTQRTHHGTSHFWQAKLDNALHLFMCVCVCVSPCV